MIDGCWLIRENNLCMLPGKLKNTCMAQVICFRRNLIRGLDLQPFRVTLGSAHVRAQPRVGSTTEDQHQMSLCPHCEKENSNKRPVALKRDRATLQPTRPPAFPPTSAAFSTNLCQSLQIGQNRSGRASFQNRHQQQRVERGSCSARRRRGRGEIARRRSMPR